MDENKRWQKNRELAELLGWAGIYAKTWWLEDYDDTREVTSAFGTPPNRPQADRPVPDFYDSLDACVSVLPEGYATGKSYDVKISALLGVRGYVCTILEDTPPFGVTDRWSGDGDTRAAALASAVLAWARTRRR